MRILHFYQNFLGGGGVANGVLGLVNAQKQLGHDVLLAAMEAPRPPLYEPMGPQLDGELLTWRSKRTFTLGGVEIAFPNGRLADEITRWRPEIVHAHGEFLPLNLWLRRALKLPMILTPHGAFHPGLFKSGTFGRRLRRRLYVRLARPVLYKGLHAFHAVSPLEEDNIRRILPAARVYSLPEMMPSAMQSVLSASSNGSRRLSSGLRVLFVGRLDVYCKGLDILLHAFAQAARRFPWMPIFLKIVGPDWRHGLPSLQGMTRDLGILDLVQFTGPLPREGVVESLSQSDLFVLLSRYDGCPLSLAEALLKGVPSVASTQVGLVTFPEVASLPFLRIVRPDPGEAAQAIADSLARRLELRALGQQHAHRMRTFYEGSRIGSSHIEQYSRLLKSESVRHMNAILHPANNSNA